jgi:glycosyltransferase involved in cell wall biosynthesis
MKIKILVDAHVFDEGYQGTTTYIKGLYNALVHFPEFEITLAAKNVEVLRKHFIDKEFKFIALKSKSKIKRIAVEIPRIIKANRFDFAHFQYITPLIKGCQFINTIHDLLFLDFPKLFPLSYRLVKGITFRYSALRSDLICTVSNYSKNSLIENFGVDEKRITITPNAVTIELNEFQDIKVVYGLDKFILFVSRFEPRKNHYGLLNAFVDLTLYKEYKLVFIGKREDVNTADFDKFFTNLPPKISNAVVFLENIPIEELFCFYRQADLFVYPSLAEGFGIPPLEAALAGCKVLCSNKTAMADFDFFGKYLFNPLNEEEFKAKMISTLLDGDYPFEEISNSINKVYSWVNIATDFALKLKTLKTKLY